MIARLYLMADQPTPPRITPSKSEQHMGIATTDFDRYERNFYETFANPPEGDIRFRSLRSNLTDEYHTKSATFEDIENFEGIFRYDKNKVPALETMRLQSGLVTPKKATAKKRRLKKTGKLFN